MEKTYFISFEGIDGCGKDTQLHKLAEAIRDDSGYPFGSKYSNVWITREPTKITESGRKISALIRERDVSGEEATEYYVRDRIEHSCLIQEFLKHSHVLCSRYDLSTLSYQMTQGMDFDELVSMHRFGDEGGCIEPDVTVVFDLPVELALERTKLRDSVHECFEVKEFQERLRVNLKYCVERLREMGRIVIVVDASGSIDVVREKFFAEMKKVLSEQL